MNNTNYKYRFFDDYSEGAHPQILEALSLTNFSQNTGYGNDSFCQQAVSILKDKTGNPEADIHLVSGGTQANLIALSAMLRPYESVIAPLSGHIAVNEAGAIEATGHKINTVQTVNGKLYAQDIQNVVDSHRDEHMVKPRAVFISQATEIGTIYKKDELELISQVCRNNNLYLYMDGARLGSALTSSEADMTLPELSALVDMFYIGGTKNGALLGEALVINNSQFKENFRFYLKQKGALLAKGRVLGIQFVELFKGNLFFDLSTCANAMAARLAAGIKKQGYTFLSESSTNQIFPILPNAVIEKLKSAYGFYVWTKTDTNNSAIRLVTSWATQQSAVDEFLLDLGRV
jgi:threonine aldolase